jgi:hypothetical protein
MMAHPAVWAIVINNFSFHYAFYVIMNWLPTYFNRWDVDGGQIGQQWKLYTAVVSGTFLVLVPHVELPVGRRRAHTHTPVHIAPQCPQSGAL